MTYQTYSKETHGIALEKIDSHALQILETLRNAGFLAFVVGGGVRDLLLDRAPKDFDISTSAKPEEIKKLFRNSILIGRRFRLAHIRFGRKIFEVSTFRAGDPETSELILRDNTWGTPEEDVKRRDFTINGLFYDSEAETVIDYVQGYPDIQKRYLRTIGQPFLRFRQDPVRMLRMLKFQARFGFEVDPEARIALLECRSEILKSSQARVLEELLRMLESGAAQPFFRLMADHGMLHPLLPELGSFLETDEGSQVSCYLEEIDRSLQDGSRAQFDRAVLIAALVYPMYESLIIARFTVRERKFHLGEALDTAFELLDGVFGPFFQLPRRMKGVAATTLASQYRLTPLEKVRRRSRVPSDPDFALALELLYLRQRIEPGLSTLYDEWSTLFKKRVGESKGEASRGEGPGEEQEAGGERRPRRRRNRRRRGGRSKPPAAG